MPKMTELVVRAGKYFSVGILVISCLPVLLPSLFFFSFFGFAFVLPMVCALAGFYYLRKYVGMLYQKLPSSIFAAGCSPWRGRRRSQESAAPTFFIDLPPRNVHAIETFEAIDPEFDAVLISTVPREVQRETIGGARDADISAGLGAVPGADVSADHATIREGLDVDAIGNDTTTVEEKGDDDPLVESGTRGQGTVDDSSAGNETRRTGADGDTSAEIGTSRELREDDTYTEGARKVRIDGHTTPEDATRRQGIIVEATSAEKGNGNENGTRRQGIVEATSAENGNRKEEIVKVACAEDGKRKQGIDEDTSPDDANGRAGIVEDTSGDDGNRKKRRVEVTSTEDRKRTDGIDEALATEDGTRTEGIDEHISVADETKREGIDEDTSVGNVAGRDLKEDDIPVEDRTTRDGEDETPVETETRRWERDEDEQSEDELGETPVVEGSDLRKVERSEQLSEEEEEEEGDELEHPKDDKVKRSLLVDTERDEGLHTLSSCNYGRSVETIENESRIPVVGAIEEKGYESEVEPEPKDNTHPEVVNEEQEDNEKGVNKALDDDTVEPSVLSDTERDEGLHTLSSGNCGRSVETLENESRIPVVGAIEEKGYESEVEPEPEEDNTHPEVVNEEQEDNEKGVNKALDDDTVEPSVLSDTERDEGLHTLSSGANYGRSFETLEDDSRSPIVNEIEEKGYESEVEPEPEDNTHSEVVNEEHEDNEKGVNKALDGEAKEKEIESLPQASDEDDQERTLASSTVAAPITPHTSAVASVVKSEGVKDFLPHQAHENDIGICKGCGWKYPNAKPSAKLRKNHKKHCNGSPSPGAQAFQDEGMHTETFGQQDELDAKARRDLNASSPRAGSSAKERQFSAPADEERMRCSPSRLEDDEINPLHDHNSKRACDDDGEVSSANSRGYVGQSSGIESESFRSVDFEFPSTSESFRSADFAFPSITSETFRSADDDFSEVRWASFRSAESHYRDEQDQLDQVHVQPVTELQLSEDLNAVKGIVGDEHVSTGPLLEDIEELSEFLGIDLPPRSEDLPEIEWAKLAIEVMKVVVGID